MTATRRLTAGPRIMPLMAKHDERNAALGPNPSGLCQCDCGQRTEIAKVTRTDRGWVAGQPKRFIYGHSNRPRIHEGPGPNPGGMCWCNCGQPAPLAEQSNTRLGYVKGQPVRYILGHYGRPPKPKLNRNGCWIWQGVGGGETKDRPKIQFGNSKTGRREYAYRVYWEAEHGPIPIGWELHHRCENPMCVRPDHLEPLTPAEHTRLHKARGTLELAL